jgi:hypothetical protein
VEKRVVASTRNDEIMRAGHDTLSAPAVRVQRATAFPAGLDNVLPRTIGALCLETHYYDRKQFYERKTVLIRAELPEESMRVPRPVCSAGNRSIAIP